VLVARIACRLTDGADAPYERAEAAVDALRLLALRSSRRERRRVQTLGAGEVDQGQNGLMHMHRLHRLSR
jgi:hypothetical protein